MPLKGRFLAEHPFKGNASGVKPEVKHRFRAPKTVRSGSYSATTLVLNTNNTDVSLNSASAVEFG